MTEKQKNKARELLSTGKYKIGEIYKSVFGNEYTDDCNCPDKNKCNCFAGQRCIQIVMLQYE